MTTLRYKHDRAGNAELLQATVTVDGLHGASGANGVGSAQQLPEGIITAEGWLKLADGQSDYPIAAARPGIDPMPDQHRLTIRQGLVEVATILFVPVLDSETATILDINVALAAGRAIAVTPEQMRNLEEATAEAQAATNQLREALAGTEAERQRLAALTQQSQAQLAQVQGQLDALLTLNDISAAYTAAQTAAQTTLALEGWAIWPVEGSAAVIVESTNADGVPLVVTDNSDGTATLDFDPDLFGYTEQSGLFSLWRTP